MRSLRSRFIIGSALIAVVPLAVSMYLFSLRVETSVRTQAAHRLNTALGGLRAELRSDGERINEKLQILGRDPVLKRLFLLRPSDRREFSDYLSERRFLLGLDFLLVSDTSGAVASEASPTTSDLPGLAMAASAPIQYENRKVGVVTGGLLFDAGFLRRLTRTGGMDLVLRDGDGHDVAATIEGAGDVEVPPDGKVQRVLIRGRSYLSRSIPLEISTLPGASVTGLVSTASADQTIAMLQMTSAPLGALGLGIAIVLGILWSSQISRPVERLAAFSRKLAQGEWDEPLILQSVPELQTLVEDFDRMRRDLATYRDKLVTSERHAAWSQMARKVAHEIKNPLTPIAVSVADLKRSYEQKREDFPAILDQAVRTIGDEVDTLKRLLQEFSDFGRFPAPQFAPCRLLDLLADLETLYGREIGAGRLVIARPEREITFSADAGQIRQMLVNLIKNGLEALEGAGRVVVSAEVDGEAVVILVSDTGRGLGAEAKARLFVPGFTTKAQGSGLGLTIIERIVNEHSGAITVDTGEGRGTTFRIRLPLEQRN